MACKNTCRLCDRLVISESVVYTAGTGLVIRIPTGSYNDNEKYCIVVGQAIPDTTVINARNAVLMAVLRGLRRISPCRLTLMMNNEYF